MTPSRARPLPEPPLLIVTDRRQARRPLDEVVAAVLDGGCRWLLLREKDLPADRQEALLRRLLDLGRPRGAVIMVSGDAELAARAGADGVHLPRRGDPEAARRRLGPVALVGRSAHDLQEATASVGAGADYVTLSPIFATASKPGYGPALGPDGLRSLAAALPLPVVALGGIDPGRVHDCLAAGAAGIAIMGEVMRADDPAQVVAHFVEAIVRQEA